MGQVRSGKTISRRWKWGHPVGGACCYIRNGSHLCFLALPPAKLLVGGQAVSVPTSAGGMVEVWLYQNHTH